MAKEDRKISEENHYKSAKDCKVPEGHHEVAEGDRGIAEGDH